MSRAATLERVERWTGRMTPDYPTLAPHEIRAQTVLWSASHDLLWQGLDLMPLSLLDEELNSRLASYRMRDNPINEGV